MTKYNKSEIMKKAWELFRAGKEDFAVCLHRAWTIAKMVSIGNLWEKYGKRRVYFHFDFLQEKIGLWLHYYKTGNLSVVKLNGETISNAEGRRWIESMDSVYYDLEKGSFFGRGKHLEDVVSVIKTACGM